MCRPPPLQCLLRVEAGEVLADDLLRLVAFEPLRTGVPAGDMSRRVEEEDGVVGGSFYQQSETLLTGPQFGGAIPYLTLQLGLEIGSEPFGLPLLGSVSEDQDDALGATGLALDGGGGVVD